MKEHREGETKPELSKKAEPFLKWAGGKSQLLEQYKEFIPRDFNNYIEPFVGGGAVYFHLFNSGYFTDDKKIVLIDSNDELINCYQVIKENVERLISMLLNSKFQNRKDIYYKIRDENPQDQIERAARTIYLNKTCFNGLYRVNSKGKFNVPFGRYKNPLLCDSKNLKAVNEALKKVEILYNDFEISIEFVYKDDFIYLDPPYQPISKTANFTSYTRYSFGQNEQIRLHEFYKTLDSMKCNVMLSNSDTPFIRDLYKDYRIEVVSAKRAISCKAEGRGKINELVILNY